MKFRKMKKIGDAIFSVPSVRRSPRRRLNCHSDVAGSFHQNLIRSNFWVERVPRLLVENHLSDRQLAYTIEMEQEQAPFLVFVNFFSSFEHSKNQLIMVPNNTKISSKRVFFFSYLTMNDIVIILPLLKKNHQI
jgi:hypothetical protein